MKASGAGQKPPGDKRVGELLIQEGLINEDQLQKALAVQAQNGRKIFEILIDINYISKEDLHAFLSKQSGVPSIDLKHYHIPRNLISVIPAEFAWDHVVLPIDKLGKLLTVGMACPLDTSTIAELQRLTGLRVKAMLCKFDDIHTMIQRYYPLDMPFEELAADEVAAVPGAPAAPGAPAGPTGAVLEGAEGPGEAAETLEPEAAPKREAMPRADVLAALESVELLPAAAGTVEQVASFLEDSGRSVREVAGIVGTDPALTSRILALANAAPYGLPERVTNINLAVTLLGRDGAHAVARQFGEQPFLHEAPSFSGKAFWRRSMFCAAAAMAIAKASTRIHAGDAYTAGLLHDIGRLALAEALPDAAAGVDADVAPEALLDAEEAALGITHPEAGYLLARRWHYPASLADAIRFHHTGGSRKQDILVTAVALAATMSQAFEEGLRPGVAFFEPMARCLEQLGLEVGQAIRVFDMTAATLRAVLKS